MKTYFGIILICILCKVNAQTIEKFSLDSGGASVTAGGIEILYTIGEVVVQESSTPTLSISEGFINSSFRIKIQPIVYLQGPLLSPNTVGLMNDDLRVANLIPTTSPYTDGASCDSSVFSVTGNNAIVDWVWVELRDSDDSSVVLKGQSALLQRDGDVVSVDGASSLTINRPPNNYYVVVNHRNHLGAMSATPIQLTENNTIIIDFTNSQFSTFGNNARAVLNTGESALWAGETNGDNLIQYSGTNPDATSILSQVLNDPGNIFNFTTFISFGYSNTDLNMDGNSQYTGTSPDTTILLENALGHPENFLNFSTYQILEQLPSN